MLKRIRAIAESGGWKAPAGAVYVGRGTLFQLGNCWSAHTYRRWLEGKISISPHRRADILAALPRLRGKDLACTCPLGWPGCHADVLLELANAPAEGEKP